jgi:hypothetical protein
MPSWCKLHPVLGRRGLLADYVAAVRGTLAVRREKGQVRIELAFAGAAMIVAFVAFYTLATGGDPAESADAGRAALGLSDDGDGQASGRSDGGLVIGDGDGFEVDDGSGDATGDPGAAGVGAEGTGGADGGGVAGAPGTTGADGLPVGSTGTGVLPSEGSPGGQPGSTVPGGGHGDGGTETSLPPTTGGGTSTSSSTTAPGQPSTSPTTAPPASPNAIEAILDLLGL